MKAIILNSNTSTRFRFGKSIGAFTEEVHNTQKNTSEYLHSDTLWSALVNAWAMSSPETINEFISSCERGEFKISSTYYSYHASDKKGEPIFFLPKPVSLNLTKFDEPKRLKKIKFISKAVWELGLMPEEWFDKEKCTLLQNETIVALRSEIKAPINLFATETTAKTSARNIKEREDVFYFQTDLYLLDNVQWYFLIDNNLPEELQSDFQLAMNTLINLGVGGERTTGCGSLTGFEELVFDVDLKDNNQNNDYEASMSLIACEQAEVLGDSLYQIIKRGGRFFEKGKSLPMIQMLMEGAVLKGKIEGRIVELNSKPKILRYGLSFPIPLHSNYHTTKF